MADFISIVIPNRNGERTIGRCLGAAFASKDDRFEVVVVDDCSTDRSVAIIERFPCRLVRLPVPSGASVARNVGARHSTGDILFFTDADCLVQDDTLAVVREAVARAGPKVVVGGTYTLRPADPGFFSAFQSVFVRHFETSRPGRPDYVATHAMAIDAATFRQHGGFAEEFLPILEDVEFSHRLRRAGCTLVLDPRIEVRHIFDFSLRRSLGNAFRKSRYWTQYSLGNGDWLADSGTASIALKVDVAASMLVGLLLVLGLAWGALPLALVPAVIGLDLYASRGLIRALHRAGGPVFASAAVLYWVGVYPLAVGGGALAGVLASLAGARPDARR